LLVKTLYQLFEYVTIETVDLVSLKLKDFRDTIIFITILILFYFKVTF